MANSLFFHNGLDCSSSGVTHNPRPTRPGIGVVKLDLPSLFLHAFRAVAVAPSRNEDWTLKTSFLFLVEVR